MALNHNRTYYTTVPSGYVIFRRGKEVLLSRRFQTGYRDGEYSLPAGHIEQGEFAIEGSIREAREEVGAIIQPEELVPAHFMYRHCGDHERIDFFFEAKSWKGELASLEPNRCDELRWCPIDELPENTVPYIRAALERYNNGQIYSEFTEESNNIH